MDAQIIKKNGESFNFEDFNVIVKDFIVSSIEIKPQYGDVDGSDKQVDYGATYGIRTIRIPFIARARDYHDYPLLRDLLFEKVLDKDSFYIRERRRVKKLAYAFVDPSEPANMDESTDNQFLGGKRYLVRLRNTFELEQMVFDGEGELIFETTELPFAESIGTTQIIQQNGINANDELWGYGMGLIADDDSLRYTHGSRTFRIYNAGNVPVHPFEQDLKITIRNVVGSTNTFELRNTTNGTFFKVDEAVSSSQTIIIDGPKVTRNGLNYLSKTDYEFIELAPGWNHFSISGATSAEVEFDFRFYYK